MGFITFIVVAAAAAHFISDLSDFINQYSLAPWIGGAIAALAAYRYIRRWFDQKEEEHKKALEEEDRRRMAMYSPGMNVNLNKKKSMGDDEDEDEDSFFSDIQHMTR